MRLSIKNDEGVTNELKFGSSPIFIGRRLGTNVFLSDTSVSREHARIDMDDGKWFVEDLESANKTFLNEKAVHRAKLSDSDVLKIGSFTITVFLDDVARQEVENASESEETLELEAMLSTPRDEVVVRNVDGSHAPAMRLAAKRLTEFSVASEAICEAENLEDLVKVLVDTAMEQFDASCVWCGVRKSVKEPIFYQVGKCLNGETIELEKITLNERITQSLKTGRSLVLPQVAPRLEETDRIRSALVTSIKNKTGSYGALYVHNPMKHKHYSLSDLDYLMLIAMHTAAVIKKFL